MVLPHASLLIAGLPNSPSLSSHWNLVASCAATLCCPASQYTAQSKSNISHVFLNLSPSMLTFSFMTYSVRPPVIIGLREAMLGQCLTEMNLGLR